MMSKVKSLYRFLSPKFQTLHSDYKTEFKPRFGHGLPPHKELYSIVNKHRNDYSLFIDEILKNSEHLQQISPEKNPTNRYQPHWNNGFLPGLDILSLYTFLTTKKPGKYVEIGSGNSTLVAAKAKREHQLSTEIISIDPQPRAEMDEVADKIIREPFENIDFNFLNSLGENDILFVDNSHRVLPNSDATVFFLEVLPRLKKGVIVHIHDIYIPYDYPQFMCDRFYSEQYMLAAFLLANPTKYRTIMPNYFVSEDPELSKKLAPFWNHDNTRSVERHGGSYWLQIME